MKITLQDLRTVGVLDGITNGSDTFFETNINSGSCVVITGGLYNTDNLPHKN